MSFNNNTFYILVKTFKSFLTAFLLLFVFLTNLACLLAMAFFLAFAFSHFWISLINTLFHPTSKGAFLVSNQGAFTLAIFLVAFIKHFFSFALLSKNRDKIQYSRFYIRCFAKPEFGVKLWLNWSFYISFIASLIYLIISLQNSMNICSIDVSFLVTYESSMTKESFYDSAINTFAYNVVLAIILSILSFLFIVRVDKQKALPILQALLIIVVGQVLFLLNLAGFHFTLLALYNYLLLASILSCLICLTSNYLQTTYFLNKCLIVLKKKYLLNFYDLSSLKNRGSKQPISANFAENFVKDSNVLYLSSFLSFITFNYFLHWLNLFNATLEDYDNFRFNCLVIFLFISYVFWLYLAFRYLSFSASLNYTKTASLAPIPFPPIIVYYLDLKPLLNILYLSWFDLKKQGFYSFGAALMSPTHIITKNLSYSINSENLITMVPSPAESSLLKVFALSLPFIPKRLDQIWNARERIELLERVEQLEIDTKNVFEVMEYVGTPVVKNHLKKSRYAVLDLQSFETLSNDEIKTLINKANSHLIKAVNHMDFCQCECASSSNNLVTLEQAPICLQKIVDFKRSHPELKQLATEQTAGITKLLLQPELPEKTPMEIMGEIIDRIQD